MGYQLAWMDKPYLSWRLALWCIVSAAAAIDTAIHLHDKPKGYELHRMISVVLAVFVIQEAATTAWVMRGCTPVEPFWNATENISSTTTTTLPLVKEEKAPPGCDEDRLYSFMIVWYNFTDAIFMALLLLIGMGWKITREQLDHRKFVFWFPALYFVTTMVADFVLDRHVGHYDDKPQTAIVKSAFERGIFFICYIGSTMALFYGWWWILAVIAEERKMLKERLEGPLPTRADRENSGVQSAVLAAASSPSSSSDGRGSEMGPVDGLERVDLAELDEDTDVDVMVVTQPGAESPSSSPSRGGGRGGGGGGGGAAMQSLSASLLAGAPEDEYVADMDGVDGIPDRAKLRLLSHFSAGVSIYLVTTILVLFVGAMLFSPGSSVPVSLRVLKDLIEVIFVSMLVFRFRLRKANPYYMLADTEAYAGPRDDADETYAGGAVVQNRGFEIDSSEDEGATPEVGSPSALEHDASEEDDSRTLVVN